MTHDVEYSVHKGQNERDDNLCKSDAQVDINWLDASGPKKNGLKMAVD